LRWSTRSETWPTSFSCPVNPYDGHTLAEALEQVEALTDQRPNLAVVVRGYRGHGVEKTRILISGQRRGLTPSLKTLLRRRSAIESEIGHMKTDGRLARCPLKGTSGDAVLTVLCGCGHNIRKILDHLRALCAAIVAWFLARPNYEIPTLTAPDRVVQSRLIDPWLLKQLQQVAGKAVILRQKCA
jgi:hypothetical protein